MLVLVTGINIGLNLAFWIKNLYCMYLVLKVGCLCKLRRYWMHCTNLSFFPEKIQTSVQSYQSQKKFSYGTSGFNWCVLESSLKTIYYHNQVDSSNYTQYGPITNVGIFPGLGVLYFCPDFQGWRSLGF